MIPFPPQNEAVISFHGNHATQLDNVFVHSALDCKGTPGQQTFYFVIHSTNIFWLQFQLCGLMGHLYVLNNVCNMCLCMSVCHRGMMMRLWWTEEGHGLSRQPTLSRRISKVNRLTLNASEIQRA